MQTRLTIPFGYFWSPLQRPLLYNAHQALLSCTQPLCAWRWSDHWSCPKLRSELIPIEPTPFHSSFGHQRPQLALWSSHPLEIAAMSIRSPALLLVLVVTLLGYSTSVATGIIPTPIIGDALFEDITTPAPIIGEALFEDNSNLTDPNITRHLQAAYPPNGFQTEMLNAVNKERTSRGLNALCMNKKLENAAQGHSNDMAAHNYMSHKGSDGSTMSQRIKAAGYKRTACGENVAAGHTSVEQVMAAWMASKHHRDNILRPKFTMFGCGYAYNEDSTYQHYWTQNFGASKVEQCS